MQDWDEAFDWTIYFGQPSVEVYKMVVTGNDDIQGAIALERKTDHVYVHLIESAPHNRFGKEFDYTGEHLMALACQRSIELGHDGFVMLHAKTKLIAYYQRNMLARPIGGASMIISDVDARYLIELYLR